MLAADPVLSLETVMRASSIAVAAALAVTCMATSLQGQRPDRAVDPRSAELVARARAQRAAGNLDGASDTLETALAVDPRNRVALTTLADLAKQRGLPGTAVRLYREALLLDPNDTGALRGQGEALVDKGAVHRAEDNLAKIRTLCKGGCADAAELAAAISRGPPMASAQALKPAMPTNQ